MKQLLLIALTMAILAGCGDSTRNDKDAKPADCQVGAQPSPLNCNTKACMDLAWGKAILQTVDADERLLGAQHAQEAMENGIPGQAAAWKACKTSGSIIPANYYQDRDGRYCREYALNMHIVRGSTNFDRRGIACRQPNGIWKSVQ